MNFIALTIFPEMFSLFSDYGIIRKAIKEKKILVSAINIRDFAQDKHHVTDDKPYGGGCGMVMKPEPLAGAIRAAKKEVPSAKTILLTPVGRVFDHKLANEFKSYNGLILVCGRYEGVDERICHDLIDYEVSLGDYVLTGGELALAARIRRKKIHFQAAFWNMHNTQGHKILKEKRFRRSCCPVTTRRLRSGVLKHHLYVPF